MLAPLAESAITEPGVVRMGHYALPRWQQLIASLTEPVFFQQAGTLIVWHRQDAAEAQRFTRVLEANQQTTRTCRHCKSWTAQLWHKPSPRWQSASTSGLYLPGEGQLDNRQLLASLLAEMTRLGVQMHWNAPRTPEAFAPARQGNPTGCSTAGAWAPAQDWKDLRGVRGEVVRVCTRPM